MNLRIMVSRHSVFYSPVIAAISAGFLERLGLSANYSVLAKGQRSADLIREGSVDIVQSAVSSNWGPMARGESPLPVHFAQINRRDGFFLLAREPAAPFEWRDLAGQSMLADHGLQPLAMLKYAASSNHLAWERVEAIDAGSPEEIAQAFREGRGSYVHLQSPDAHRLVYEGIGHIVASVGASMSPVAFSSLCCSRHFMGTEAFGKFLEAFGEARNWVRSAPASDVAREESDFFPGCPMEALTAGVEAYQKLGCWDGDSAIPPSLYEQAVTVFQAEAGLAQRYPYRDVCWSGVPEH